METTPTKMIFQRARTIITTAAMILVFAAHTPRAIADEVSEDDSLKGIEGVMVIVERLHEDAKAIGLERETIDAVVRDGLQKAGVKILSSDERLADPRKPYLYVNCNVMDIKNPAIVAFSIDIEVHQVVTLAGGETALALTWAKSYLGVQGSTHASEQIRHVLAGYVEQFAAALKKANGQSETPAPKTGD